MGLASQLTRSFQTIASDSLSQLSLNKYFNYDGSLSLVEKFRGNRRCSAWPFEREDLMIHQIGTQSEWYKEIYIKRIRQTLEGFATEFKEPSFILWRMARLKTLLLSMWQGYVQNLVMFSELWEAYLNMGTYEGMYICTYCGCHGWEVIGTRPSTKVQIPGGAQQFFNPGLQKNQQDTVSQGNSNVQWP